MTDRIKLTKEIWNDFLDTAVDASGSAGWAWFQQKYGFTSESFEKLILENQRYADKFDEELKQFLKTEDYNEELLNKLSTLDDKKEKLEQEIQGLQELNTKLSKALAEEIASNFSQAHLRANLEEKLEKIQILHLEYTNHIIMTLDFVSQLGEILKEEKS